jgi:CheY-like chemotaxis protein
MKTILIIDDEYDHLSSLEMLFSLEGYSVRTAHDGEEGLEDLKTNPFPDLILVDLMMPVLDGYGFISALRKNPEYDQIPVIIASISYMDPRKLKVGDWDYFILKPFDLKKLMSLSAKAIAAPLTAKQQTSG